MSKTLPFRVELKRKIVHLLSLFLPLIYSILEFNIHFIILMIIITSLTLFIDLCRIKIKSFRKHLYYFIGSMIRQYENKGFLSSTYLIISFCLITLLFDKHVVVLSMIIAALCDSVAAIIGQRYGRVTLIYKKTLEGSCSFFICSLVITSLYLFNCSYYLILLISLFATLIELFTPTEYDNLTLPILSAIIIHYGIMI